MVVEAKNEDSHVEGLGVHFKLKPPDEVAPFKENEQRMDAIYEEEPLGFEKVSVALNAKMRAHNLLKEVDLGDRTLKRPTYISAKLSP